MGKNNVVVTVAAGLLVLAGGRAWAADPAPQTVTERWIAAGEWLASADTKAGKEPVPATKEGGAQAPCAGHPPLPFISVEGYSGGAITPMAYMCNAEKCCNYPVGKPAVAYTFMNIGTKKLQAMSVTETFFSFVEIGYAFNRLDVGNLYDDIFRATRLRMRPDDVWLHHFNARVNFLQEKEWLPAISGGVHFKYNAGVKDIDHSLNGALSSLGFHKDNGVDYTLTATKTLPTLGFGRPVILTGGMRWSEAAQLGFLGFGDTYHLTFECSAVWIPIDGVALGYEFRQKHNPYKELPGLVGDEDNWHVFSVTWIVNKHLTLTAAYGLLGTIANTNEDNALGFQVKWEF